MQKPSYIIELCLTQKGIDYIKNNKALTPKFFENSIFSNYKFDTISGAIFDAKNWKAAFKKDIVKNMIIWERLDNIFDKTLYCAVLIEEEEGKMIFPNHPEYGQIRKREDLYYIDRKIIR